MTSIKDVNEYVATNNLDCFWNSGRILSFKESPPDIIAFLDEFDATDWEKLTEEGKRKMAKPGEKTMKHVIAGEADESVIEWRLQLLGSIPTLEARVKGEDAWFEIAYPCENKFYVETDTLRTLGFTEFDFE
jgi:hypothetical protein